MANLFSYFSFDQNGLSLYRVMAGSFAGGLIDDRYLDFNGSTYRDAYIVDWDYSGSTFSSIFGGETITTDTQDNITGGTATGYLELFYDGATYSESWGIEGISIDASALYRAAHTATVDDEQRLISQALSGDDTFVLSRYNDRAAGLGGNDTMYGNGGNDSLYGGSGRDYISGGQGSDRVIGGAGGDRLFGGSGNDLLNGGGGADRFVGGAGRDVMFAGNDSARDTFVFGKPSESSDGSNSQDTIRQFDAGEDILDLSGLDANNGSNGNQAFGYSNGPAGNSVWVREVGNGSIVQADTNGDGRADFEIMVRGEFGLTESDFIL